MPEPTVTPNVDVEVTPEPSTQAPAGGDNTPAQETSPATPDVEIIEETPEPKEVPITALHEERDKRQALQTKLDNLSRSMGVTYDVDGQPVLPNQVPNQNQAVTPDTNVNSFATELEKTWEEDPRKAVQMEINAALTWYDGVSAGVDSQMESARSTHKDFNLYSEDVSKYIRMLPPGQRNQQGIIENAYWLVKGQKVDTVLAANQQANTQRIQVAGAATGMGGGTSSSTAAGGTVRLTAEQVRVSEAMNMTPQEYAAGMKK